MLLILSGCGDGESNAELTVRIEDALGRSKQPFFAWWGTGQNGALVRACPVDAATSLWRCTPTGIAWQQRAVVGEVTIKTPTTRFATVSLRTLGTDPTVTLSDLPVPEQNANFATGFERGDSSGFATLAVEERTALGPATILKFYIANLDSAPKLYLQNTRRFSTHFDFAQKVLGVASTPGGFAAATYHGQNRTAMAGTLTHYPTLSVLPVGQGTVVHSPFLLEFFPSDDLSPQLVTVAHRAIEEAFGAVSIFGHRDRLIYVPAGSRQEFDASNDASGFDRRGILWARAADLYSGVTEQSLNPGLAYGTLRQLDPDQLANTVVSYRDILLLTRLPNDLPLVAGTLTEELQTPLAHVNLLAKARHTPNLALKAASRDERISPFLGQLVRFEVMLDGFSIARASAADAEAFYASRQHASFTPERDLGFSGLPSFDEVGFADFVRVGSKAANLAELRHVLPDATPKGFAIPFSAYQRHLTRNFVDHTRCDVALGECVASKRTSSKCDMAAASCRDASASGQTIDQYIQSLLVDDGFTRDTLLRDAHLSTLRSLILHSEVEAGFAQALDARVAELFGNAQVRLRSSTNVEDLVNFNGAGLYESYSAFAAGDQQSSSVVRRVWASVFGFGAFEERTFWNVNQHLVAMGVSVNQAFDGERANGVVVTGGVEPCKSDETYVNVQLGEVSVTNPPTGEAPETLCIIAGPDAAPQARILSYSTLSPKRAILLPQELANLDRNARLAAAHFAQLYGKAANAFSLDLEFKLLGDKRELVIKQARPFVTGK